MAVHVTLQHTHAHAQLVGLVMIVVFRYAQHAEMAVHVLMVAQQQQQLVHALPASPALHVHKLIVL